jgi:hypothetical protein
MYNNDKQIERQLEALQNVYEKAKADKDFAIKLLSDAGLWEDDNTNQVYCQPSPGVDVKSPAK